jgi:hypothetical protein
VAGIEIWSAGQAAAIATTTASTLAVVEPAARYKKTHPGIDSPAFLPINCFAH